MLEATFLKQRVGDSLNQHFKAPKTVGDLLNSKAHSAYVRQCIEQTALSPFERAALLALLETMEINQ